MGGRSDFHVEIALGVSRTRSRRRLPVEKRASPELVDKLIDVPWLLVLGDPDSTTVPTGISAELAANSGELLERIEPMPRARKGVDLRMSSCTLNCLGCDAA